MAVEEVAPLAQLLTAWEWDLPNSDTRWMSVKCGNHDDRQASARCHIEEGAYICLACGVKASSPVNLVIAVKGLPYREALRYLGELHINSKPSGGNWEPTGPKRPWRSPKRKGKQGPSWRERHHATA